MNIQTTKRPVANLALNTNQNVAAQAEEKPADNAATQETFTPQIHGEDTRFKAGIRKGAAWGGAMEKTLGTATGLGIAIGSGLALSLGGAMVGGLVGGSFGPAVSALQSSGPLSFFANSFANMGTAISVGSTIGSLAGIAGGFVVGQKVGGSVASAIGFAPGFVTGLVAPGSAPPPEANEEDKKEPKHAQELRGLFKGAAKVGGGVGLLSGGAGGFVAGATLTAAGSLVADVAKGDFSFSNFLSQVGGTALIGGAIGGVAGAAIGAAGGEMLFGKAPQWAWDKTAGRFTANQPGIQERIEKREGELQDRQSQLETRADNITRETKEYREQHAATSGSLDQREDQMKSDEKRVSTELETVETRIEDNAQADFKKRAATPDPALDEKGNHAVIGERQSLDSWDAKLKGWQGDLDNFRSELIGWENKLDTKIDREAATIFGEERKPIDKHFADLHGQLDQFEGRLNTYEADINNRISDKYQSGLNAEKPGVVSDLNAARSEKERSESELRDARAEKERAESRHNSAQRSLSSARQRLSNAESEESRLRSRISSLNSRISSLQSQLGSCRASL
ncbi:MAG: hypothetical protein WC314_04090 [Vulcanimicrobiota bacterium]